MANSYHHTGQDHFDEETREYVYLTDCGKRIPISSGSSVDSEGNTGEPCPDCASENEGHRDPYWRGLDIPGNRRMAF